MILKPDDTQTPQPKDPATENAEVLDGKSLKAFPGQEHDAHIMTHLMQSMSPIVMQNPLASVNLNETYHGTYSIEVRRNDRSAVISTIWRKLQKFCFRN